MTFFSQPACRSDSTKFGSSQSEQDRGRAESLQQLPVSVVIPARNEEATISALLQSLLTQTRLPDEIIVVNAGSVDGTLEVVGQLTATSTVPIKVVDLGPAYPGRARNTGIREAKWPLVALLDAGVRIGPRWLEELVEPMLRDASLQAVYGNYEPLVTGTFQRAAAVVYMDPKRVVDGKAVRAPTVASLLLRKDVCNQIGGFPEAMRAAEDLLFKNRLEAGGFARAWAAGAVIYWELPDGPWALFLKFLNYSRFSLLAGLAQRWHVPVLRLYLICLMGIFPLYAFTGSLLWPALLISLFYAGRAAKLMRKKYELVASIPEAIRLFPLVGAIVIEIDAAMYAGLLWWLIDRLRGHRVSLK